MDTPITNSICKALLQCKLPPLKQLMTLFEGLEVQMAQVLLILNLPYTLHVLSVPLRITLPTVLAAMHNDLDSGDWILVCGNEPPIRAHGLVLAGRWPYFASLLNSGMSEAQTRRATFPIDISQGGLTPNALRAILEVIYLNQFKTTLTARDALALHCNAELYGLTDVEWFEELALVAAGWKIEPSNCLEFYAASHEFPGLALQTEKARQMILGNRITVLAQPNCKVLIEQIRVYEKASLLYDLFVTSQPSK